MYMVIEKDAEEPPKTVLPMLLSQRAGLQAPYRQVQLANRDISQTSVSRRFPTNSPDPWVDSHLSGVSIGIGEVAFLVFQKSLLIFGHE